MDNLLGVLNDIRSIIRELWIIAFILSFLVLMIHDAVNQRNVLLSIGIALGYGLAFALNDFYDRDYDKINPKKAQRNFFVRSKFSRFFSIIIVSIIFLILILIFGQFGLRGIFSLLLSIFILWAYSAPPFRFKSHMFWDFVIPMFFMHSYPYLLTLFLLNLGLKSVDYGLISLFMISSLASQIEQQIRDFKFDGILESNTTQKLGLKRSVLLMQFLSALLIIDFLTMLYFGILPVYIILLGFVYLIFIVKRFLTPETGKNQIHSRIATIIGFCIIMIYTIYQISTRT